MLVAAVGVSCSIEDAAPNRRDERHGANTPTTGPTTTQAGAEEPLPASAASVEIAGGTYDLDAECYSAGVDEIVVTALTPSLEEPRVELYLQAFVDAPYVGITITDVGGPTTYEPSLDRPPEIVRVDDVFRVDGIALVTGLDLETGEATDAGTGTIVVDCGSYAEGLPPGFVSN